MKENITDAYDAKTSTNLSVEKVEISCWTFLILLRIPSEIVFCTRSAVSSKRTCFSDTQARWLEMASDAPLQADLLTSR